MHDGMNAMNEMKMMNIESCECKVYTHLLNIFEQILCIFEFLSCLDFLFIRLNHHRHIDAFVG